MLTTKSQTFCGKKNTIFFECMIFVPSCYCCFRPSPKKKGLSINMCIEMRLIWMNTMTGRMMKCGGGEEEEEKGSIGEKRDSPPPPRWDTWQQSKHANWCDPGASKWQTGYNAIIGSYCSRNCSSSNSSTFEKKFEGKRKGLNGRGRGQVKRRVGQRKDFIEVEFQVRKSWRGGRKGRRERGLLHSVNVVESVECRTLSISCQQLMEVNAQDRPDVMDDVVALWFVALNRCVVVLNGRVRKSRCHWWIRRWSVSR